MKRRERKEKEQREVFIAWTIIYALEAIISAGPAAVIGVVLIEIALKERGCWAVGGEWIAILAVYYVTFRTVHKLICDLIFGEEE